MRIETHMPTPLRRIALAIALLAGGTALPAAAAGPRYYQADQRFPPETNEIEGDAERGFIQTIRLHHQGAAVALDAGNLEKARAEWTLEAAGLVDYLEKFRSSEYRIPFRYNAAKLFAYAQQPGQSALQAEQAYLDDKAEPRSKALASHLAAQSWLQAAMAKQKAGELPAVTLPTPEQRQGRPLQPVVPPGEWKRFVEAADAYLKVASADPELAKPVNERVVGVGAPELALRAAQVEYAFDDMEDAQGRLGRLLANGGEDLEVEEQAIGLYLQTFLVLKDEAGAGVALERLKAQLTERQAHTTDPKAKDTIGKLLARLAGQATATEFNAATRLLEAGRPAEAAAAYDAFVAAHPADPLLARALNNGAIAYDKAAAAASEADRPALQAKATGLREQLLTRYPDSELAPTAQLRVAEARARDGHHEEAATRYGEFVAKNPQSPFRCGALQNLGIELETLKRPLEAAGRYLDFAGDARCKAEDPNTTGKLLFHAAELYEKGKKKAEAKAAYGALVGLGGAATDVVVKSYVKEAKTRLKGL